MFNKKKKWKWAWSSDDDNLKDIQDQIDELEKEESDVAEEVKWENELQEKYDELNNKYLRLNAEFENFKKRTREDTLRHINMWAVWVLKAIVWFFDNFKRATEQCPKEIAQSEWWKGIFAIEGELVKELVKKWFKIIEAKWEKFDANKMEALVQDPNTEKDTISNVIEDGYEFNWELVRAAKVVVGSK